MSWHKGKKELTEESTGEGKHGQKKREQLFKKRFSPLSLFSGSPKNKFPQGRSPLAEDKRRRWRRRGCGRQEEARSLPQPGAPRRSGGMCPSSGRMCPSSGRMCPSSGRMCPSCEILLCRPCGTLHSQRAFIAHSLLDHYDPAALPC